MYKTALLLFFLLVVVVVVLFLCSGINMKCEKCYTNGNHFHCEQLSVNTNHGPKTQMGFMHAMCPICKKNPGYVHFHGIV